MYVSEWFVIESHTFVCKNLSHIEHQCLLSEQWITDFRKILKLKIGKNWTVYNSRGNVRLQVGRRPNEETLTTAYKWSEDTWIDAFNRITTIHQILTESNGKID